MPVLVGVGAEHPSEEPRARRPAIRRRSPRQRSANSRWSKEQRGQDGVSRTPCTTCTSRPEAPSPQLPRPATAQDVTNPFPALRQHKPRAADARREAETGIQGTSPARLQKHGGAASLAHHHRKTTHKPGDTHTHTRPNHKPGDTHIYTHKSYPQARRHTRTHTLDLPTSPATPKVRSNGED